MMLERGDLKRLRVPLVVALLLSAIGISALMFAEQQVSTAVARRQEAQNKLKSSQDRLQKVSVEEQEISNNLAKFKQFTDRGMTGEERRLEWIETLATIRQQRRLFAVRYALDRQRPVDYPGIKAPGNEPLFLASRMKLELLVLHEGDLLSFISDLAANTQSFASLRSCQIARVETSGGGGPLRPRLRAECIVDMITLKTQERPA